MNVITLIVTKILLDVSVEVNNTRGYVLYVTDLVIIEPDRGRCSCNGQCECLTSPLSGLLYSGPACDCSPDNNTCINPDMPDRLCSGRGTCDCGECVNCNTYFIGQYCETCTNISVSSFTPVLLPYHLCITKACPVASCSANLLCARCAAGLLTDGCDQCTNTTRVNNAGQGYRINGKL